MRSYQASTSYCYSPPRHPPHLIFLEVEALQPQSRCFTINSLIMTNTGLGLGSCYAFITPSDTCKHVTFPYHPMHIDQIQSSTRRDEIKIRDKDASISLRNVKVTVTLAVLLVAYSLRCSSHHPRLASSHVLSCRRGETRLSRDVRDVQSGGDIDGCHLSSSLIYGRLG